jgi:hypothetical protein
LKGVKIEDLEDVLVIWVGQVNGKNAAATDEIMSIKGTSKTGQQMSVTVSVHKNW